MKHFSKLLFVVAICAGPCLADEEVKGDRECNTFSVTGGFWSGKQFKSNAINIAGVSQSDAMTRATQALAAGGWKIANTDEKLGIISADTTVNYGEGKTAPLNVSVSPKSDGVILRITYAISGGQSAKNEHIAKQFCTIADTVSGK